MNDYNVVVRHGKYLDLKNHIVMNKLHRVMRAILKKYPTGGEGVLTIDQVEYFYTLEVEDDEVVFSITCG